LGLGSEIRDWVPPWPRGAHFGYNGRRMATSPAPPAPSLDRIEWKPAFVLASSVFCLILLWYFGRLPFFREHIAPRIAPDDPDMELYAHWWLAGASVVTRTLLPLFFIVVVLRESPRDFGWRLRGSLGLAKVYLALLAVMLPLLYIASGMGTFTDKYPQYHRAGEDMVHFLVYEASYFFVFLSGESFWRGYMVFGLRPRFGYYAIPIMAMPYVIVHFGKPFPEALGALLTGCILGWLALRHRSFWLGVALHFSVALGMDVMALWRKGELPW
jgi:membrane protease YdiL (CAAX protease family)